MEAAEAELEPCPFCDGPAVLFGAFAYTTPAVFARCSCCRCSTPFWIEGLNMATGEARTMEEQITAVVELWNRRSAR